MNLVINILVVFCIGIVYSSANSSGSDVAHTEKSPAEGVKVPLDHSKVQKPLTTNATQPVTSKIPVNTSSSIKDEPVTEESKTKAPVVIDNKSTPADTKNTSTRTTIAPKTQNTTSTVNTTTAPPQSTTATQNSTVTTTTEAPTSTAAPVVAVADHAASTPTAQERQFDGPSFVGGIVLTVGLTVIGFIAFKFYKSGKIERSYRTL